MEKHPHNSGQPVEIWGGLECTINRVRDRYMDQFACNGHYQRLEDLDLIAEIGLRTLRYPILWERTAPDLDQPDWQFADERLAHLRQLGIHPIVGLVHHGSGPRHTHLASTGFAEGLARYARMVAERYPWVQAYTPVNEPLTTARFSGLYGLWYPHHQSDGACVRMLLNQCKATVLAMAEIRKVRPDAQLVQTEDLGQCHSTPLLAYQATFENHRRWLTFDLLCGKVDATHPLYPYLRKHGASVGDLQFFLEHPCPPDLIGINHYLTSERFLDERLHRYPAHLHGGNGRHQYVDVEAVRVPDVEPIGPYGLLKQTWERYGLPIAVTEAHLGCTKEEQMRWFHQVWQATNRIKAEGADIRAVTAWSLFGSYDWNSLLTVACGHYEPGVFDLRSEKPRATALAHLLKEIIDTGTATHPVLNEPGWWQRPERWIYAKPRRRQASANANNIQPILITDHNGPLEQALARICISRGLPYLLLNQEEFDTSNPQQVDQIMGQYAPWAVINTRNCLHTVHSESEPSHRNQDEQSGTLYLAEVSRQRQIRLLTFSADLVFDGTKGEPYVESDPVSPADAFGNQLVLLEQEVLRICPDALIVRSGAVFGPWDEVNFVTRFLNSMQIGQPFPAAAQTLASPTYLPDLVQASMELLIDGEKGIWHLSNGGQMSWAELGRTAALQAGFDPMVVEDWYAVQVKEAAGKSPNSTALTSEKASLMPSLSDALSRYAQQCEYLLPIAEVG
jgi:dTDP-4-dehydrorhamnose reductase